MDQLMKILSECCPGVDFEQEQNLVDDGIITSLDIVTIVSEIMEVFDIEISVDDLMPEHFNSTQAMFRLIEEKRA